MTEIDNQDRWQKSVAEIKIVQPAGAAGAKAKAAGVNRLSSVISQAGGDGSGAS